MAADLPSLATPAIAPGPVFLFSDTSISYLFESSATDPGSSVHFVKNIANVTHVDAWTYGTNFASASFLQSTNADPATPAAQARGPAYPGFAGYTFTGQGSLELYTLYRGSLSGNALTHSKQFAVPAVFIKDVSLYFGADGETQNVRISPEKKVIVAGLQIAFDVPGYLTVAPVAYKEWNHNGLAQCGGPTNLGCANNSQSNFNSYTGTTSFNVVPRLEVGYFQPLSFTGLPLAITGVAGVTMPKGLEPISGAQVAAGGITNHSHTEITSKTQLVLDIGKVLGYKKGFADIYVGYKYWANKYGNNGAYNAYNITNGTYLTGTFESQVYCGMTLHVF